MSELDKQVKTKTGAEALEEWLAKNREVSSLIKKAAGTITAREQQLTVTVQRLDGSKVTAPTQASWNEVAKAFQELVREVMATPFIADLEAHGFTRYDYAFWLTHTDQDLGKVTATAREEVKQYEHLPADEYIKKFIEIENRLNLDLCLEFLRERKEKKDKQAAEEAKAEADKCLCTALAPRLSESYKISLNNYQTLEKILAMEPGESLTLQVGKASVAMQRLTGDPLTDADKWVLFATCEVAKNNTILSPRLADAENPKGKYVPFAGFLDVASQMKEGKVRTNSGLYKAVVESLARLTESKYFYDYRDLVNSPDLKERAISAEEQALIEGRRAIARSNNGKAKEGIIVSSSWIMDFLARAGNPGVFDMFRKYLSGIRIDGREDLEMFARILKRATSTATHQNRQRVYAAGRPAEEQTFFKACRLLDISTISAPTSSQRSQDLRQRQKLEGMLSSLKETGDFEVKMEREGRAKKLVAFEVRLLGREKPTIEGATSKKTLPRGGKRSSKN